jgi:uncharacterized membrane protein HdeD (DUF308 family)
MTDPQNNPANSPGQSGGVTPPASGSQQAPGSTDPAGASAVGTTTRGTASQPAGPSIPAQGGQPSAGRARYGRREHDMASAPGGADMFARAASASFGALLFGSLAMIAVGVMLLVWPHASLTVVAILIGAALVASGLVRLFEGFTASGRGAGARFGYVVIGLLAVIAGLYCIRHHGLSLFIVAFVTGVYFVLHGITDLGVAFNPGAPSRGLRGVLGIFSVCAGIIMIVWPALTVVLLLLIVASWLLLYGIALGVLAFGVRRAAKNITEAAPTQAMATPARAA